MSQLSERPAVRTAPRSRGLRIIAPLLAGLDLGIIAIACLAGVVARNSLPFLVATDVSTHAAIVAPVLILGWLLAMWVYGAYREDMLGAGTDEFRTVLRASLSIGALLCIGCYLTRFQLSRGFFVLTFAIGIPLLLVGRMLVRKAIHRARLAGSLLERVLIVGGGIHVDEIARVLKRERWLGYRVMGALTPSGSPGQQTAAGIPVLGSADVLSMRAHMRDMDVLFLAGGIDVSGDELRRLVWDLEDQHAQVVMAPTMTEVSGERLRVQPVGGLPLVHLAAPTWSGATRIGKRLFDVVGSAAGIFLISPILLAVALRIKLHDRGPVFFKQTRVGRDGQEFACWKFRTMVVDAEAKLAALHAAAGFEGGLFKMENDPRITKPGKWLRRFSLDELPQLFNVFGGSMSLVGPRPPLRSEVESYDSAALRRLHIRPGMTGLWQVSGRSNLTFEEAVRLDLFYVDNWSMVQDLAILGRTVGAVLARNGAY